MENIGFHYVLIVAGITYLIVMAIGGITRIEAGRARRRRYTKH